MQKLTLLKLTSTALALPYYIIHHDTHEEFLTKVQASTHDFQKIANATNQTLHITCLQSDEIALHDFTITLNPTV